jgi:hypothetical protein
MHAQLLCPSVLVHPILPTGLQVFSLSTSVRLVFAFVLGESKVSGY